INKGLLAVKKYRDRHKVSYYFNTGLHIPFSLQKPFVATHDSVAGLELKAGQATHKLAALWRRVFSAIVSGNVRPEGIRAVEERGPFRIRGEAALLDALDALLGELAAQGRMKLSGTYRPSYVTERRG
ncbi:MAG: DUF3412 domain-containing protein, partial [Proteobacteria bacterium]|nr:DUF3412 domain-containing protein [Pseudomonadota bacterium]